MAGIRIVIGDDVYTGGELIGDSVNAKLSNSLACDELTVDSFSASILNTRMIGTLLRPSDADGLLTSENDVLCCMPKIRIKFTTPESYDYGTQVYAYYGDALYAKFYVSSVERVAKDRYDVTCVSAIGLLDTVNHYGGIYTGQKFSEVLADIIGGMVQYRVDDRLSEQLVFGHLPIDTRRNNLHQLLFAVGASVFKDDQGDMYISVLSTAAPEAIGPERIYLEGSVTSDAKMKRAVVTEHAYTAYETDNEVTLYEGEVIEETVLTPGGKMVSGTIVMFDAPMHDLYLEDGSGKILESGANYAVLAPAINLKLIGKEYTHTTRLVVKEYSAPVTAAVNIQIQDTDAVVEDATLVTVANSSNVAERVLAYYRAEKTVNAGILQRTTDKPGMRVSFTDIYGEPASGYVKSMDVTMSSILKADSEIVCGYAPTKYGNNYNHYAIPETGNWTVPSGVYKIRIILISGGQGGELGTDGSEGLRGGEGGNGGAGGEGGEPGSGGEVFIAEVDVTPGQIIVVSRGKGGRGAYINKQGHKVVRMKGDQTYLKIGNETYFSVSGTSGPLGYYDVFSGQRYAMPGRNGVTGGNGRSSRDESAPEPVYQDSPVTAGKNGRSQEEDGQYAFGGGGGGAAYGADGGSNGGDGENATATQGSISGGWNLNGGEGGTGADGGAPWQYTDDPDVAAQGGGQYILVPFGAGWGGCGGHGGGGGGGGGVASGERTLRGDGGQGGKGGRGGDGYEGCAIILY